MTYYYPLPRKAYRFRHQPIDITPLTNRYTVLAGFLSLLITVQRPRDILSVSRRIARLVKAYVKVAVHNHHMERKLKMLLNPIWRARVLNDLGGVDALNRWDGAVTRAQLRREGCWIPKRAPRYKDPEPVWHRSPERIAESERLKAHKRDCARACVNPLTMRNPYKMDRDGLFRLAPLPRQRGEDGKQRQPVIYSAQTIGDYSFNAVPVYKPEGLAPAPIWPVEFYAAIGFKLMYERRQYEDMDLAGQPALIIDDKAVEPEEDIIPAPLDASFIDAPSIVAPSIVAPSTVLCKASEDHSDLINFIGHKNYNYIFENPV